MTTDFKGYCPRCSVELCAGEYRGLQLDMCNQCFGILLERQRLLGLLDAMSTELREQIDLNMPLEAIPDRGVQIVCPRCRSDMEHNGYMEAKWVMIDSCSACQVVWLDTDELGLASLMYARSRMRAEHIHKNRYEPPSLAPNLRTNRMGGLIINMLFGRGMR